LVTPSEEHGTTTALRSFSEKSFTSYSISQKGIFLKNDINVDFDELEEGGIYSFGGEFYKALMSDKVHRQVDAKVLEEETTKSVQLYAGKQSHRHFNYEFEVNGRSRQIDGIVHVGDQDVSNSTVFIIEAQINPPETKIDQLLTAVNMFNAHIPSSVHFKTVTSVIPVLGAKTMSENVAKACQKHKVWKVLPCGYGGRYTVIRAFHTIARIAKRRM